MKQICLFVLVLCFCTTALMAQPPNNTCGGAISLTMHAGSCSPSGSYTNVGATASGMSATCTSPLYEDIFFSVVADNNQFTIEFGTMPFTSGRIIVYTSCGGGEIYCAVLAPGNPTHLVTGVVSGNTYYIRVASSPAAPDGPIDLCVWSPSCAVTANAVVDQHESCGGDCDGQATASGSGGTPPYTYSWSNGQTSATATGLCDGTYTVTVTDDNGCSDTDQVTINPGATVTASVTKNQEASCPGGCDGSATASASGGTGPYTYLWTNGNTNATANDLCEGPHSVTVTDANGCSDVKSVTIASDDTTPPDALCQDITVSLDGNGDATITASEVDGGSTDNCGSVTLSINTSSFDCSDIGSNSVTLTVTDGSGNTSSCPATVTVEDNEAPTITCPTDITVNTDPGVCSANNPSIGTATGTDNCGTPTITDDAPTIFPEGMTTVVWTADDGNGNTATCNQTVTVEDNENPVITCPTNITVNTDPGSCDAMNPPIGTATGTDNCGTPTITDDAPTVFPLGMTTVTWTADDGNGNTATCNQTVTVEDNQPPIALCQDITVSLNASGMANITANQVNNGSNDNCGSVTLSINTSSFDCSDIGPNSVLLTVTDGAGNTDNCSATVTVEDNLSPSITCPANVTVSTDPGVCSATNPSIGTATATDNCGTPTITDDAPAVFPLGTTTVTWTADDGNGNTSTCTQQVTVEDAAPPIAVCQNITVSLDGNGNATITANQVDGGSTDNCGSPSLSINQSSFNCSNLGANSVVLTATDGAGNADNCTATVTVEDNENPVITCPANVTVSTDPGSCDATNPSIGTATGTDNCGTPTITDDAPTTFSLGMTTVTWTATDAAGNTVTCMQTVTVEDQINPTITCPANVAVCEGETVVLGSPTTADNCAVASVTNDAPGSFSVGTTIVTWTVTDDAGNTASCEQEVLVRANPTPTISGNTNICQGQAATLDAGSWTAYIWTTGETMRTITVNQAGSYGVTVTDVHGCEGDDEVEVTVTDSLMPVITGPANVCAGNSVTWDAGDGYASYLWNTGETTRFIDVSTAGAYSVTVTNAGGCSGSTSKTLTVDQPPVATARVDADVSCEGLCDGEGGVDVSGGTAPYEYLWPGGQTTASVSGLCAGDYVVTVTDANGCSDTATLTIDDGEPYPTATATNSGPVCEGDSAVLQGNGSGSYAWTGPNGFSSTEQNPVLSSVSLADAGEYTLIVTNVAGCSDTATTTLVVHTNPVVDLPGTAVICAGESIELDADAGPGTSYLWNTGATSPGILVNTAGTYIVTVTNTAGCTTTDSTVVSEQNKLQPTIVSSHTAWCPGETVSLTVKNTYASYLWSTGDTTKTTEVMTEGIFSVTVTNTTGCVGDTSITLVAGTPPEVFLSTMDVSCYGDCNGAVTVDSVLGEGPFSYLWNTGDTVDMIQDVCAGDYTLTVIDANGCESMSMVTITEPEELVIQIAMDSTVMVRGGTQPYADTMIVRDGNWLVAGVADTNGCTAEDSILITGTHDKRLKLAPRVYPNPTNDIVYIDYADGSFADMQVVVMDMQGRVLQVIAGRPAELSMKGISSGLYHLVFISDTAVQTVKIARTD